MDRSSQGRVRLKLVPVESGAKGGSDSGVRWNRVKAARRRIAAGFYDGGAVRDRLVDALLRELQDS